MRRLPLRLLRSAASGSLQSPTLSCHGCPTPRASHLPAKAAAAPAELARWLPRRTYSRFASGFTPLEQKKLGSILDVERAKGLSPEHLVAAWDDYHLGRGHIGVSMKAKLYHLLEQRSATCPYFVIPLCGEEVDIPPCLCKCSPAATHDLHGARRLQSKRNSSKPLLHNHSFHRVCRNQGYSACPRRRCLHQQTNRCRGEVSFRDGALLLPERCAVQARGAFQRGNT